jgi:hypothetical protein
MKLIIAIEAFKLKPELWRQLTMHEHYRARATVPASSNYWGVRLKHKDNDALRRSKPLIGMITDLYGLLPCIRDQSMGTGILHQFRKRVEAHFFHQPCFVRTNCFHTHVQFVGDLCN